MTGYYFARRNGDKEDFVQIKKKWSSFRVFISLYFRFFLFSRYIFCVFFFFFRFRYRSEKSVEILNQSSAGLFAIIVRYFVKFLHTAVAIVYRCSYEQEKIFISHEGNFV